MIKTRPHESSMSVLHCKDLTRLEDKGLALRKSGKVKFGNDDSLKIKGKGVAKIDGAKFTSKEVLLVEGLKYNLLSVSQLCESGHEVTFTSKGCTVKKAGSAIVVAKGSRTEGNLYQLGDKDDACLIGVEDQNQLWHRRLGHINQKSMRELSTQKAVSDLPEMRRDRETVCEACQKGKMAQFPHRVKEHNSSSLLSLVHTDLCGPMRNKGTNGELYFMLLIDDYSRMTCIVHLRHKNVLFPLECYGVVIVGKPK